jgi:phage-related protein
MRKMTCRFPLLHFLSRRSEKEILWRGSAYDGLLAFPDDPRCTTAIQLGRYRLSWNWKTGRHSTRRGVMCVANFEEAVYVVHYFQKKVQQPVGATKILRRRLSCRNQHEERQEMKIDTEIRHETKPGANLFLELGSRPKRQSDCKKHLGNRSTTRNCSRNN